MARRSHRGHKASAATRAKESAAHRGKKHPHRGVHPTSATRAKESAAHRGKKHPHKGHRATAATRAKISRALKGRHPRRARRAHRKSIRHTHRRHYHLKHKRRVVRHLKHKRHLKRRRRHSRLKNKRRPRNRRVVRVHGHHRHGAVRRHAKGKNAKIRATQHARWHHRQTHGHNSRYLHKKRRSHTLWKAHKGFGKTQILQSGTF